MIQRTDKKSENKKIITDVEYVENLRRIIFDRGQTKINNDELFSLIKDDSEEDFDRDIEEFLSRPRNMEQERIEGEAMYESIMSRFGDKIPRDTPKNSVKMIRLRQRPLLRFAAVVVPLLLLGGSLFFVKSDRIGRYASDVVAIIMDSGDSLKADQVNLLAQLSIQAKDTILGHTMPDGSVIRLEKGAKIEYSSNFNFERKVRLTGNAFFSVTKMNGKTFEVLYDDMTIRVLGTEFFVSSNEISKEVTLKSGSVQIENGEQKVLLEPNQKYVMRVGEDFSVHEISEAEMAKLTRGRFDIRNVSIEEALKITGEFFDVNIQMQSSIKNTKQIMMDFNVNDDLEDVLFTLKALTSDSFEYTIKGSNVIITQSK